MTNAATQASIPTAGQPRELPHYLGSLIRRGGEVYEPAPDRLTAREHDILELLGEGMSNKAIARSLHIAPETVKSHVKRIFEKLGVGRRAQAVVRAETLGLVGTK